MPSHGGGRRTPRSGIDPGYTYRVIPDPPRSIQAEDPVNDSYRGPASWGLVKPRARPRDAPVIPSAPPDEIARCFAGVDAALTAAGDALAEDAPQQDPLEMIRRLRDASRQLRWAFEQVATTLDERASALDAKEAGIAEREEAASGAEAEAARTVAAAGTRVTAMIADAEDEVSARLARGEAEVAAKVSAAAGALETTRREADALARRKASLARELAEHEARLASVRAEIDRDRSKHARRERQLAGERRAAGRRLEDVADAIHATQAGMGGLTSRFRVADARRRLTSLAADVRRAARELDRGAG